jgi:secondary thiamine-phosphate synthase enzyme
VKSPIIRWLKLFLSGFCFSGWILFATFAKNVMIKQSELSLPPFPRGYHLIDHLIERELNPLPEYGILHIFLKHTSAGLCLNENADPDVRGDFERFMNKLIPENDPVYEHTLEGSDDMPAHLKSSLLGQTLTIPISRHRLNLGTWQGIYLCEFRNRGGNRKLVLTVYS